MKKTQTAKPRKSSSEDMRREYRFDYSKARPNRFASRMSERFHLKSAVHLFLMRGDEILLLRRHNTGYEDGSYSVIAGHLNGGEQIRPAMAREAREEAGIDIEPGDLEVVHVMHRKASDERIDFFLKAARWQGEPVNCEPHKCDELRWCRIDDLPANTIPYIRQAIDNMQRGVTFDSFGWDG